MTTGPTLQDPVDCASPSGDELVAQTRPRHPRVAIALVAAGPLALAVGLVYARMWEVLPWERLALSLVLAMITAAVAWPVRRFVRLPWALALALVWMAALPVFVGPIPVLSMLLLAAAALALGTWLVPMQMPARASVALCVGLALLGGLSGWTLAWPIHSRIGWGVALLALVVARRQALMAVLSGTVRDLRHAVALAPRWAGFAAMLFGLASTACWIPTMQVDDLGYHLGLPSHLRLYGEYRPDPAHQIWAYAPWLGDVLQGIGALLAGQDARGAVNALWLGLCAPLAWTASALIGAAPRERWTCVALVASFPPLAWMAGGMQTELPATALLLAAAVVATAREPRWLLPMAVLFAGMAALKTMHPIAAAPLAVYAFWRNRAHLEGRSIATACVLAALIALSSYAQAWWHTGNPLMPLFNNLFHSPYLPDEAYRDERWFTGFSLALPWQMTFNTPRYVEAFNGGIGFGLIALAGVWLLALLRRSCRGIALALTLAAWLPLLPMQYVRYAYPGLIAICVLLVVRGEATLGRRGFAWLFAGLCVLNLAFQANSGWLHHSAAIKRSIRTLGDPETVFPHYVPERILIRRIPADDDGIVLATDPARAYIAELGLRGRGVLDHDPGLFAARKLAEADASGRAWHELFRASGARWILVVPERAAPPLQAGLALARARRIDAIGDAELWRIDATPIDREPGQAP